MQLQQFDYTLPPELIAQNPVTPRDHSRLLHLDRLTKKWHHYHFYDLPTLLSSGDVLVINNTKVMPARLRGRKTTGGELEVLLLKKIEHISDQEQIWEALSHPGLKVGQQAKFAAGNKLLQLECLTANNLTRNIRLSAKNGTIFELINSLGDVPTPPYVKDFVGDPQRYQTVFAKHQGSAAAPTAGLHFTPQLMSHLKKLGIQIAPVTLHVGLGTFAPVKEKNIVDHQMHSEWFDLSPSSADIINQALKESRRVIAVGTTSLRTLESAAVAVSPLNQLKKNDLSRCNCQDPEQNLYPNRWQVKPQSRETDLFVYPPHHFKIASGLITNFHLPQTTLLMLVTAFTSKPQSDEDFVDFQSSWLGHAYQEAMEKRYRLFSFGDAMLIT